MPRVVPSQVVAVIDQNFPSARANPDFSISSKSAGVLKAIIRLTSEIPTELLELNAEDYSDLICAIENLSSTATKWEQRGGDDSPSRLKEKSPVAIIREALSKCPDESPAPGTVTLAFINDTALANSIRTDISAANRDAANGEWKGATVLAGAAAEALLLWAIEDAERKNSGSYSAARIALRAGGEFKPGQASGIPETWNFFELIAVAQRLNSISKKTADQASLCREFRNLIHPGPLRKSICDRGTALSALAAVELIARDLTP
jgi:hypothetical protein